MPGFRPLIEDLNNRYHRLTLELGALITESLGEDPAEFFRYFDPEEPYLAASLNHNYALDVFTPEAAAEVRAAYERFDAQNVGTHIDGPPFVALLINDRPGLQVVAGEGRWLDAPVTCRTARGDYDVPVIPGSVIIQYRRDAHASQRGRYGATLHRVNTTLIPPGETRVSMPYFLLPKMEGDLIPFGAAEAPAQGAAGYHAGRGSGRQRLRQSHGDLPHGDAALVASGV